MIIIQAIKFSLVLLSLFIYLILGIILRFAFTFANPLTFTKVLNKMTYFLMHIFTTIGGFKIKMTGEKNVLKEKGIFIISPHIGYIDAVILGTLIPGSFTTKKEVKKIPLLGSVVSIGNSIFIDRKKKNNIITYVDVMAERLANGINIFNFPEGHATNGKQLLPFFPSFFNAPLQAKSPIVPITVDYAKVNGDADFNRDDVYCYDGKVSTIKHLWNLMKLRRIDVIITVHDKIYASPGRVDSKSRTAISNLCLERLSAYTKKPVAKTHPLKKSSPLESKK